MAMPLGEARRTAVALAEARDESEFVALLSGSWSGDDAQMILLGLVHLVQRLRIEIGQEQFAVLAEQIRNESSDDDEVTWGDLAGS